jgi:FixJ family two-component response regulator
VQAFEHWRHALGMLSVAIAAAAIYVHQTLRGEVRPHPLSWFATNCLVPKFFKRKSILANWASSVFSRLPASAASATLVGALDQEPFGDLPYRQTRRMKASRCVHIIDDEAEVRDALTLLLSTAQIESRSYGSAEEYLTSNPLNEPACILLDNQLPGMSGIELLRQIVAATKDSTVIMITAYGDVPTAVSAMRAGAFHFVQKPFDAEALLATVEEALSRTDETRDDPHEIKEFNARQALLTQREREVLALLLEGLPTKFIAQQLRISSRTAEHHRAAVIQKMQARNISHLMRMAFTARNLNGSERAPK